MKKLYLFVLINTMLVFSAFGQSDGCSSATSITMNATCVPTAGTTTGATQTIAGCAGTADDDVWYQFTATATSVQIIVTAGDASFDPVVQLFSGSCSTLISLACTDNTFGGGTETVNYSGLTIGQTYRVRVYHYFAGSGSGNFTICVKNAPAPPSNDDCTGATALPVNVACSFTNATTDGASESQLGCAGNADDDVWFSFVATNSLQNVLVHPIDNLDLVFEVFEGGCGSLNTLLCQDNGFTNDDEQSDLVGLTPGQTYFVRVYDYYGGVTGDFQICVTGAATPAPVNDEPCTAIALPTVTSECNYGFFTTTGATASLGAPTPSSCVGGSGAAIGGFSGSSHDVWFSVVVPSSGSLDIIPEPNGGAGTISDGVMALYSGTCGALTQIACADDYNYPGSSNDLLPLITATGLTPGSTVYIRYWGFGSSFGDFGLCVTTTTNDDCANALYICDPNGYSGSTSPAYTPDRPSNMFGNNETSTGINLANGTDSGGPFGDGQPWDMSYSFSGSPALDVNIENNSWIKFTASATTVTLNVSIYDCWVGSYPSGGMQMQIFEATNCTNFIPVSNFAENSTGFVLTANGLTIGQDYYLMIDGYAGDICSYTISANSGVQFPDITPSSATICQNDAITLTAPPGATSYLWPHSGETTQSVTVNPPTTQTYVCEVTGLCDHKQTLSSVVTVNPVPTLSSIVKNSNEICSGNDAIFTINGTPNSNFIYNINGGANQTVFIGAGGTATITLSNVTTSQTLNAVSIDFTAGCSTTLSNTQTIIVNPNPIVNAGSDISICGSSSTTITATASSGTSGYSYVWDNGLGAGASQTVSPLSPTTYTVTVTDSKGCTDTDAINVALGTQPNNLCLNDPIQNLCTPYPYSATSGQSGFALILVTDDWPSEITFDVYDFAGNLMYTENTFPGSPGTGNLLPRTVYVIYDQPCINVNQTVGVPGTMNIYDSGNDGLFDNTGGGSPMIGAGVYTYFYAADASENITNDNNSNGVEYITPGYAGMPAFYTASTAKRTFPPTHANGSTTITFPPLADHEYISTGSWAGPGVSNVGTTTKTYFSAFPGLTNSVTVPTGNGTFDPSVAGVGTHNITYTYNDVYGVNGPAACNTVTTENYSITVNPLPNAVTISTNSPICVGQNAIFTLSGSANSTVYYSINSGVTQSVTLGPLGNANITLNGVSTNQSISLSNTEFSSTGCNINLSNSAIITVNPLPIVTANASANPICTGDAVTLTGSGASTYSWTGGVTNGMSFTPASTGTYTVTGTDANGCQNNDNITITVNPLPTVAAIASANPICAGDAVTLTGSGASTYNWTGGVTNGTSFIPASTATYTITGTDANGCQNNDNITVTVNPLPTVTANASANPICNGDAVTLTGSGANTYSWTGGVTNGTSFIPASTATYTVTGTDANGCQNNDNITVTVNPLPSLTTLTSNSPICSGNNAIFTITGSPTATVTYTINGGANQTVVLDAAGNGTVTITGATADQTILLSDITFTSTNCSTTLNNTLTVTVNPNPTFTSLTSNTPICSGDNAIFTLSGSANATVTYTINGGANQTVVLDGSGNGTVTVTGATSDQTILLSDIAFASGCNTVINNTTTVTVNPNPNITSIVGTNPTSCGGNDGYITISGLTASTNYNVSYDDGGTTVGPSVITSNASGEIIITGLSQGNYNNFVLQLVSTSCSTTDNTSISLSDPSSPTISGVTSSDPTTCSGTDGTVTLSGLNNNTTYAVTYDDNGTSVGPVNLTSNGSGQIIISGLDAGTYNNFVVDLVGCTGSNNTSAVLSDPALPTLTGSGVTSNSPICSGNNAIFTITGSPTATVTYTINGGANQTVVLDAAGNGTVTITGATADQTILLSDITFTSTNCSTTLNNTLTVTVNPNPTFTSLTSNTPICSGDDAIFTLSGSANATVTYTINGGANQTVVLDGSGNGTVTVTGATSDQTILLSNIAFASGCNTVINNTTTVTVNPNPNITSIVGTDPTSCGGNDGFITISGLTASTNYNVSYDDGGTTVGPSVITSNASGEIIITGLSQGNYNNFVLQFPSTSCSTTDNTSISLSDPGSPVINSITSTNPTSCSGTDGTITISGLTANTTYNLTYDDDGTTVGPISTTTNALGEISITGLNAGTYNNFNVEITGCSVSDNTSINITDPSSPTISGVVSSNPTTCGGSDGSITLSGLTANTTYDVTYDLGGVTQGPFSLTSNASGDIVIANLSQGTYDNFTVTVPLTGCSGSDNTQTVLSDPGTPTVSGITNANTTTCGGTDGTITISGLTANTSYNITYDDDGTTVGPTSITTDANGDLIISGLDAGAYNNFIVELAGCTTNDNTTLNISDPTPPSVDAGNPTLSICDGTAITLTATNPDGATITWDNGVSDGTSFTPSVGTIMYTVTATNTTTNCISTDSIEVTVNPEPQIDLTSAVVVDENCTDGGQVSGIITTNGTPNYIYQWIDGTTTIANTADVTGLTAGNYSLIVTDVQGCDDTTNVTINFINNAVVIAIDDSASTTGINEVTFNVYPNDTGDETSITVISQPENGSVVENGNGEMTYTPNDGFSGLDTLTYLICDPNCINTCDTATVFVTVKKIDSLIIPNGFTPNDDNINDYFVIKNLEQYPNNNIIIFNRWGDIVYTSEPYNNDWDGTSKNSNIIVAGDKVVDGTYFFVLDLGIEGKEKISGYIDLRRK